MLFSDIQDKNHCCQKKKNIEACLMFAQDHMDVPQHFWENIWESASTLQFFPTVKHGGWSIMV